MNSLAHWKAEQARVWGAAPWDSSVLSPVHEELVARLAPRPSERWLDLATGTGAVALRAARAGGQVTAQDLAPALIHTARRLAAEEGLDVRFDVGTAEELPYPAASFDVVSSAHGVVFAGDHRSVARELARVCRPGARLGLTYWRPNPELAQLMDRLGYRRPTGADQPRNWGQQAYVQKLLEGDFVLTFVEAICNWTAASGEASWLRLITSDGPAQAGVAGLSPRERDALHRDWVEYFERHRDGDRVSVPRPYLLTLGRRAPARNPPGDFARRGTTAQEGALTRRCSWPRAPAITIRSGRARRTA
jgi:2-polyprenyl-3-methyl-5-hydroxy-6-metoxy-1,4-benzoquinol methylase